MDALSGSAAIATSNSRISIFSPGKRRSPCRRRLHLVAASKDKEKDSDLSCDGGSANLVPFFKSPGSLTPLSNDAAMGLVLRAATGNGWTTDSGMEGPPETFKDADSGSGVGAVSTFPWSLFTKSPRLRMRVAFTCNVCGQRTTRAINPHAYTDGTVFVQCCGCNVFHKLVDNLNLFHEMKCYVNPSFRHRGDAHFNFKDEDGDNIFPVL